MYTVNSSCRDRSHKKTTRHSDMINKQNYVDYHRTDKKELKKPMKERRSNIKHWWKNLQKMGERFSTYP